MLELLKQLPIRQADRWRFWFRNRFATRPWPDEHAHVRTPTSIIDASDALENSYFEDASGYSLRYRGEVINMRRAVGRGADGTPLEVHLRARRDHENLTLRWNGHVEANRFTAMHEHVHEEGLTWLDAVELSEILADAGVPTEAVPNA